MPVHVCLSVSVYIVCVVAACVYVALCLCVCVVCVCASPRRLLTLLQILLPAGIPITIAGPGLTAVKEWTPAPSCLWGIPDPLARQSSQCLQQAATFRASHFSPCQGERPKEPEAQPRRGEHQGGGQAYTLSILSWVALAVRAKQGNGGEPPDEGMGEEEPTSASAAQASLALHPVYHAAPPSPRSILSDTHCCTTVF